VIVLSGQLDVGVDGVVRHLTTGDALLPDPRHPHSYVNPGPGPTTTPWS
jgi:mannose-6-phosphate isomerase-like protein (cupin superfamily)